MTLSILSAQSKNPFAPFQTALLPCFIICWMVIPLLSFLGLVTFPFETIHRFHCSKDNAFLILP